MADGMNTDPTPIHNKGKIPRSIAPRIPGRIWSILTRLGWAEMEAFELTAANVGSHELDSFIH
jgi:hypothetical protein